MLYIQVKKNNKNIIQKIKNFYLSLYKQRLYALTAYFLKEFKTEDFFTLFKQKFPLIVGFLNIFLVYLPLESSCLLFAESGFCPALYGLQAA